MSMIARATALLAALVLAAPAAYAQQKTIWRYAHVGAEGESQTRYAAELAKLVKPRRRKGASRSASSPARSSET